MDISTIVAIFAGIIIAVFGYAINLVVCIIIRDNDLFGKQGNITLVVLTLVPFLSFIAFVLLLVAAAVLTLIKEALE